MKPLTNTELMEIQGGDWDWGDFLSGASVGTGIAALTFMTLGGGLVGSAVILAWTGAGLGVLNLYV